MQDFDERHAISRARFFLEQAERCRVDERNAFEANLEAAIVFARAAFQRFKTKYEKHPRWQEWFDSLLNDATVNFFRIHRNFILKEGPPRLGQIIRFDPVERAAELYYFDDPYTPASETVRQYLDSLVEIIANAEAEFGS